MVYKLKNSIDCTMNENIAILKDGVTECCGYDFGLDGFGKVKVRYCPICGREILIKHN